MDKGTTKNLAGQPIFKQLVKLIPRDKLNELGDKLNELVIQCKSDRYYKTFFAWEQLVTLLFGILSRCDSVGEVCDGMRALAGKLNYFGLDESPAQSTAGDALRNSDEEVAMFSTIAALLRIHLVSHLDLTWVVTEGRRAYPKGEKRRNKSPTTAQLLLF